MLDAGMSTLSTDGPLHRCGASRGGDAHVVVVSFLGLSSCGVFRLV
jgi:hypothetical protein